MYQLGNMRKLTDFNKKRAISKIIKMLRQKQFKKLIQNRILATQERKRKAITPAAEAEDVENVEDDSENKDTPIPAELEKVPNIEQEFYKIPNYTNKYGTEIGLVIGRSQIEGAGLGLYAHLPDEVLNDPKQADRWKRNKRNQNAQPKFMVFKGYPRDAKKMNYIDEYKGEHIQTKSADEMDAILDARDTDKATHITKTYVIDANTPISCYASYANDPKSGSFEVNAALISDVRTKTAAIIAIKDIYQDEEIFVAYGAEYWKAKKQTVANQNKQSRKKQKQN